MKRMLRQVLLAGIAPLLMAALWMDEQPSFKPYEAPVLAPPAGSVPVTGREVVTQESEPANPIAPESASLARGEGLFAINCAHCHGATSSQPGPVGRKLAPPAPVLSRERLQGYSDADLYKLISFGFVRMPPFAGPLTPQERWDLVNYLRSRK